MPRAIDWDSYEQRTPTYQLPNKLFGTNLRKMRKDAGLPLSKVALSIGCNTRLLLSYEQSSKIPTLNMLQKIASFYNLPLSTLVDWLELDVPDNESSIYSFVSPEFEQLPLDKKRILSLFLRFLISSDEQQEDTIGSSFKRFLGLKKG